MTSQLALDLVPATERRYLCCGMPCGPLPPAVTGGPEAARRARELAAVPWPHAADCPNPSVDTWIDRETGRLFRLLWCSDSARLGGPCPYQGEKARFMPAGGCCKDLVRGASS